MNPRYAALVALVALAAVVVVVAATGGDTADPDAVAGAAQTSVSLSGPTDRVEPDESPASTEPQAPITSPDLPDLGVHPELREISGWLHSDVTSLEELRGRVVAVQFWTFGCRNCKNTLPHMRQLYADYNDQGLEIVGVHAPEFSYEAEVDNIVDAAQDLGVTWPIALDPGKRTFHHWQEGSRAFWPRIYLLDRDGHIRYDHIGEGRYDEIDAAVQALLAEPA
ncbi:MAG: redoxin domain-containing protein [Actinomycetia bacterium]|nr:redoxin domain-containing protein [Actinomycetes bacterium]